MFTTQALRQSDWRNCGLCVGLYAEGGATLLGEYGDEKTRRISWMKALVDTVGIKNTDLEDKFLFLCFAAFRTT